MKKPDSSENTATDRSAPHKDTRDMSQIKRVTVYIAVIVSIGFILFAYTALHMEYDMTRKNAQKRFESIVGILCDHVRLTMDNVESILNAVSDRFLISPPNKTVFASFLRSVMAGSPTLRGLIVLSPDGRVWIDEEERADIDLSDREYYRHHIENPSRKLYYGRPKKSRADGGWFIPISKAVYREDGQLAAIITASINSVYFFDVFQTLAQGPIGRLKLFLTNGILLIQFPYDENLIGNNFMETAFFQEHLSKKFRGVITDQSLYDGVSNLSVFQKVSYYPFAVVIGAKESEVLASYYTSLWRWSFILFVTIVCIIFVTIYQLKQIQRFVNQKKDLELKRVQLQKANDALTKAQEKIVRQERLAAIGELAGSVGHELRNPLGVISNAVYFLKATQNNGNEILQEYFDIIDKEVKTAEKIVSDLLDYSRIKSLDKVETTFSDIVDPVFKKFPPPENIDIKNDVEKTTPSIYVDPIKIGQVLMNLVVNAYQAMPDGGVLSVRSYVDDGCVCLEVADTGVGIAENEVGKVFEPLYTTKAKGIGLGLAVSKNFVEANGGSLSVVSQKGEGTIFTISLPIAQSSAFDNATDSHQN